MYKEFSAACHAMRCYSGMGSLKLEWHPYKCEWEATISFACGTTYRSSHSDECQALSDVARQVHRNPPHD